MTTERRRLKQFPAALTAERHRRGRLSQRARPQLRGRDQRQVPRPDVGPVAVQEQYLLARVEPPAEPDGHQVSLERDLAVRPGERMAGAVEMQVAAVVAQVERADVEREVHGRQTGTPLGSFCFSMFRSAASATTASAQNNPS